MISYHPSEPVRFDKPAIYAKGWKIADTADIERIARGLMRFVWSPCIWEGGHRLTENFIAADLCALDFDDGEMTLEDAKRIFCDMRHVIATTKSHQKEKGGRTCDRFRVAMPWETRIVDAAVYSHNMVAMLRKYPADPAAKDPARFFWPCAEIISVSVEGYSVDVEAPIASTKPKLVGIDGGVPHGEHRLFDREIILLMDKIWPAGHRNAGFFTLGYELAKYGLSLERVLEIAEDNKTIGPDFPLDEALQAASNGWKHVRRRNAAGRNRDGRNGRGNGNGPGAPA